MGSEGDPSSLPGYEKLVESMRRIHGLSEDLSCEEVLEQAKRCDFTGGEKFSDADLRYALLDSEGPWGALRLLEDAGKQARIEAIKSWVFDRFPRFESEGDGIRMRLSDIDGTTCPGRLREELEDLEGLVNMLIEEGYELQGDLATHSGLLLERPQSEESSDSDYFPPELQWPGC